ncbi:uncharacterized protein [Periplaneta americana]|uniref:uncharacterized protein n=1 Tax=Periplaneta americana TaxID=6978 RepID=UPI0037E96678
MDAIKMEPEVVPLTVQSCDDAVKEESQPSPDDRNSLDQHVTAIKEEYVNQSPELLSDIKEEREPNPVSFSMMKREPEERNVLYQLVADIKEDHNQDLTSEIKFEGNPAPISFPVLKREPENRKFLDQNVTVKQSPDLTSEIKLEGRPVPISFPVVKREPEEEQTDLHTVNEEPSVEVMAEDNGIFAERIAGNFERTVSSELDGIALEENENVCEIPKNSGSSEKLARSRKDEKQLQFGVSKICSSNSAKSNWDFPKNTAKIPSKCKVCGKCFPTKSSFISHERCHTDEKIFKCDVCGKNFTSSGNLRSYKRLHTGEKRFKCDGCGKSFKDSSHLRKIMNAYILARNLSSVMFVKSVSRSRLT